MKLSRLGRYGDAESLLRQTAAACTPRDRAALAPAFVELYVRSRRFDEGRRYLGNMMSQRPADQGLRQLSGRLELFSGDRAAAEREFRTVLAADPANQGAFEELVGLLSKEGRARDEEKESLEATRSQPGNFTNNLRASVICDLRHDDGEVVRCLLAAERSGPVTSGVEINLARKLMGQGRPDDALLHLAEARLISAFEGDPAATAAISQVIGTVLSRLH
jgi:Flp pilus assembly protein TadD